MSTPLIDGDIVAYKAAILGGEDEWATRGLVHSIMEEWTALARGSS